MLKGGEGWKLKVKRLFVGMRSPVPESLGTILPQATARLTMPTTQHAKFD
jgi:hypothetical protein